MIKSLKSFLSGCKKKYELRLKQIYISKGSYIHPLAKIGFRTRINAASYIDVCNIGKYCAIGGRMVIRSSNHHIEFANMQDHFQRKILLSNQSVSGKAEKEVFIGNAVWIGDSVIILPNVSIGNGCIIGAGAVVTKDIPPFSIAVGNPAKVIKMRFNQDVIAFFEEIRWWDWDDEKIIKNKFLFDLDFQRLTSSIHEIKNRIK